VILCTLPSLPTILISTFWTSTKNPAQKTPNVAKVGKNPFSEGTFKETLITFKTAKMHLE
jgi:hypothetical protein